MLYMSEERERVPTRRRVLVVNVEEEEGWIVGEKVVYRPAHRVLTVLVPVDRHRREAYLYPLVRHI